MLKKWQLLVWSKGQLLQKANAQHIRKLKTYPGFLKPRGRRPCTLQMGLPFISQTRCQIKHQTWQLILLQRLGRFLWTPSKCIWYSQSIGERTSTSVLCIILVIFLRDFFITLSNVLCKMMLLNYWGTNFLLFSMHIIL